MTEMELFGDLPAAEERWYESYVVGMSYELGHFSLSEEEIIAFATKFDPHPMHVGALTEGRVVSSGWHTIAASDRLLAENFVSSVAGLPSPGVEGLQWTIPSLRVT